MFSANSEELAQNKLLLLYIIQESPYEFNRTQLTEFILEKNYMNFFVIQQYLSELVESGLLEIVESGNEKYYKIPEKGQIALNYFINKIPESIKKELEAEFKIQKIKQKKETQVLTEYFEREDGQYIVNLKLVENGDTLFSLYLNVASREQAEIISKSWKEKTDLIYSETIKLLIE